MAHEMRAHHYYHTNVSISRETKEELFKGSFDSSWLIMQSGVVMPKKNTSSIWLFKKSLKGSYLIATCTSQGY